jgi:hypothetical protein
MGMNNGTKCKKLPEEEGPGSDAKSTVQLDAHIHVLSKHCRSNSCLYVIRDHDLPIMNSCQHGLIHVHVRLQGLVTLRRELALSMLTLGYLHP